MAFIRGTGGGGYSTNSYSISTGTIAHEVRRATERTYVPPAPVPSRRGNQSNYTPPSPVPSRGGPSAPSYSPLVDQGTGIVPPVKPPEPQTLTVQQVNQRFPGLSPELLRSAERTGLKFIIGPTAPGVGGYYDPGSNTIHVLPKENFGTVAHEFVHYAQARAPELLDTKDLTVEQRKVHDRTMSFMAARAGQSPNVWLQRVNLLYQLALNGIGTVPLNTVGEQEAFTIAGGQTQNQAFPASYFQNLYSDPQTAARLRAESVYGR